MDWKNRGESSVAKGIWENFMGVEKQLILANFEPGWTDLIAVIVGFGSKFVLGERI